MKKIVSFFLILCLLFSLCGCHPSTIGVPVDDGKEPTGDSNVGKNDHIDSNPGYTGNVRDDAHCAAPTYMKEIPFLPKYVRTEGGREGVEFPNVILIHSVEELEQYIEENRAYFDLESTNSLTGDSEPGFMDFCIFYDEAFFEKQYLVMILVEESSDAMCHKVNHVGISGDGLLYINLQTVMPEEEWDYVAQQWHILIELEKEYDVKYAENVRLGGRNYGEKHTLTVEAGDVPIHTELLQKNYCTGEIVRVRTDVLPDEMIDLYLNGKRLDSPIEVGIAPEGSTEDVVCWEFAFVMPDEDSVLTAAVRNQAPEYYYNLTYYCPELGADSPFLALNEETGEFMMIRTMYTSSIWLMGIFTWEEDKLILEEKVESDNAFRLVFAVDGKDLFFREAESPGIVEPFIDEMLFQLWETSDDDTPIGSVCPEPQEMKLVVGGNSTPGVLGEYEWTVYQGDIANTTHSDIDMLTIMVAGAVPKFEVYEGIGTLCFASDDPDDISVRRWTADGWGDLEAYTNVAVMGDSIQLEMGLHLYEVMATWERDGYTGTASYYFLIECWAAVPEEPNTGNNSGNDNDSTSDTRPGDNEFLCEVTRLSDGRIRYPATVDSEALRDFLHSLSYDSEMCECMPEYKIDDGYGTQFEANLTEGYVRFEGQQAMLTEDQMKILADFIA